MIRRAIHATLLERLTQAGVKGVAIDILLAEPDRADPAGDEVLARAIAKNGKVVLPVIMEASQSGQLREVAPAEPFAAAAAAVGHVHVELDAARAVAEAAAAQIPYPAIAKPSIGIDFKHAEKVQVILANTPEELVDGYERIAATGDRAIFQEVIPGGDDALWTVGSFSTNGGQAVGTFCGRKLVQRPPIFGTCRVGEARWRGCGR